MKSCVVGGLQVLVLSFEFHQNRLSGFGAVGVEICPSPLTWPLAYTTACTTVQAVIMTTFIILSWPYRCTVFICTDAQFKQQLVWLRMQSSATVFVL